MQSQNFGFLAAHDPLLARLGALAERYFTADPETSLLKCRQLSELLARQTVARLGVEGGEADSFADVLRLLRRNLDARVLDLFHQVRIAGNEAAHRATGTHAAALSSLRFTRQVAVWFHRAFGADKDFKPGPFVPPEDPEKETVALRGELAELRDRFAREAGAAERERARAEDAAAARLLAEHRAETAEQDRRVWEELAGDADRRFGEAVKALEQAKAAAPALSFAAALQQTVTAAQQIDLDERETRRIIDQRLREAGWEADSETLRHSRGTRPEPGRFRAIAEWPTQTGPADYVLFAGLKPIATVEAKKLATNVSQRIGQAQRYAAGFALTADLQSPGGPWASTDDETGKPEAFAVPFAFSTNGRPYLKQLEIASGVWFRDVRRSTNRRRALTGWHAPKDLLALLEQDTGAAETHLKAQPFAYGLKLRDYQVAAIGAVEDGIVAGRRTMMLAMATGTGKTKTCIALVYRLLHSQRFRRILFLVDRNALSEQASGDFATTRMENQQTFAEIYGLDAPDRPAQPGASHVVIATIQSMVHQIVLTDDRARAPAVGEFDCVVVDECHRGYLLDREMSDAELKFLDQDDYVSQYRRVLDHFDAVKIGLTATPARHTTEIFGKPVFTYSYRDAVLDGWLVDQEPPIHVDTKLARAGIRWEAGEMMDRLDLGTGRIDTVEVPDEVLFHVDAFNKEVISDSFNRVVCEELATHIDPAAEGKTLVFCVNDMHADLVVEKLKDALEARYGAVPDDLVAKITGQADKPRELIRRLKNEARPKIAATVDLLTTGIDVPEIVNLVFLRRVGSRILYEQMLGRATRLCPEIGKETYKVFDAVRLYEALEPFNTMKAVAVDPNLGFAELFAATINADDEDAQAAFRDQVIANMRRVARRLTAGQRERLLEACGLDAGGVADHLGTLDGAAASAWLKQHQGIAGLLDDAGGPAVRPTVALSSHEDEVIAVERGYGPSGRPEDYLSEFARFVRDNANIIPALTVVAQRPRDMTRHDLRELAKALDQHGYNEAGLRVAWRDARSEDIAARVIGHVRQAALGDPLEPYEVRVDRAVATILKRSGWTPAQQQWLRRIAQQLKADTIVDCAALDQGAFKANGDFKVIDRVFEGGLADLLGDINEAIWAKAG